MLSEKDKESEQSMSEQYSEKPQKKNKGKKSKRSNGRWTTKEHTAFIEGVKKYGNNWKMLESEIKTRNSVQIRSHAQKFFNRVKLEFNTKDPLKYICENACEDFQLYRFDNFKNGNQLKETHENHDNTNIKEEGPPNGNPESNVEGEDLINKSITMKLSSIPFKSSLISEETKNKYADNVEEFKTYSYQADKESNKVEKPYNFEEIISINKVNELAKLLNSFTLEEISQGIKMSKHVLSIKELLNLLLLSKDINQIPKSYCECQQSSIQNPSGFLIHKPTAFMPIIPRQMKLIHSNSKSSNS